MNNVLLRNNWFWLHKSDPANVRMSAIPEAKRQERGASTPCGYVVMSAYLL